MQKKHANTQVQLLLKNPKRNVKQENTLERTVKDKDVVVGKLFVLERKNVFQLK